GWHVRVVTEEMDVVERELDDVLDAVPELAGIARYHARGVMGRMGWSCPRRGEPGRGRPRQGKTAQERGTPADGDGPPGDPAPALGPWHESPLAPVARPARGGRPCR